MAGSDAKWAVGEMLDGVRKVRLAAKSKKLKREVFAYKVPYRDSSGKQTSKTWPTWKEAKAFRNKIRNQKNEGILQDYRSNAKFREVAESWFSTKVDGVLRPSTARIYRNLLDSHILPTMGEWHVRAVENDDVQRAATGWARTRAPGSVHLTHQVLVTIFAFAVDRKLIPATPCTKIVLPEVPEADIVPLTPDQVWAIAAALEDRPVLRMMMLMGAMTGLRSGELRGLTWDRIDLLTGVVKVDRQIQGRELCPLKTRGSRRAVPLSSGLVRLLRAYREAMGAAPSTVPVRGGQPVEVDLVFPAPTGGAQNSEHLRRRFKIACKKAGVPPCKVHNLRHTYASLMIAENESPKKIQAWLGHSSIKVTMDIYGHLYPSSDESARSIIDDAFGDGPKR